MADWVKCRSATGEVQSIWVNVDLVVCLFPTNVGTEVTYAGKDCAFVVRETPQDILGNNKVRDA